MKCRETPQQAVPTYQQLAGQVMAAIARRPLVTGPHLEAELVREFDVEARALASGETAAVFNVFRTRVRWAVVSLVKFGLVASPQPGMLRLTPSGHAVLRRGAAFVDFQQLQRDADRRARANRSASVPGPGMIRWQGGAHNDVSGAASLVEHTAFSLVDAALELGIDGAMDGLQ